MQGYSLKADLTPRFEPLQELASCLRGDSRVDLARYRQLVGDADEHAVRPLLRERVLENLPRDDAAYRELHDEALREAAVETRRNARLARVITALAGAGVPSLVFKGSALAHRHYPRPELRPRDDTDLLVRTGHLDTAHEVLLRNGFKRVPGMEGSLIMRQRLYRCGDRSGPLNLDLHWAITNEPRAAAFAPRALLAASHPLPALSPHARAPDDGDALLLACLHLDAHHANAVRLIWLYDVDLLARALPPAARVECCRRAREQGLADPCTWVLTAAHVAFGTPLDGFENVLEAGTALAPAASRGARWLRDLSRLPGYRERLQWLSQHLFPPVDYLQHRFSSDAPAWRLRARRALRGVGHLLRH